MNNAVLLFFIYPTLNGNTHGLTFLPEFMTFNSINDLIFNQLRILLLLMFLVILKNAKILSGDEFRHFV
jgi:hypothetical protein